MRHVRLKISYEYHQYLDPNTWELFSIWIFVCMRLTLRPKKIAEDIRIPKKRKRGILYIMVAEDGYTVQNKKKKVAEDGGGDL